MSEKDETLRRIGTLLSGNEPRDAVHIAVVPVTLGERMKAGDWAKVQHDGSTEHVVVRCGRHEAQGVIDPYLQNAYPAGAKCYLFLKPGSITGLVHSWSHPDFPARTENEFTKAELETVRDVHATLSGAKQRMEEFARSIDSTSHEVVHKAREWVEHGEVWSEGGRFSNYPDLPEEFWDDFEVMTGVKVKQAQRVEFFSCSC